jgi:hypothetical protein
MLDFVWLCKVCYSIHKVSYHHENHGSTRVMTRPTPCVIAVMTVYCVLTNIRVPTAARIATSSHLSNSCQGRRYRPSITVRIQVTPHTCRATLLQINWKDAVSGRLSIRPYASVGVIQVHTVDEILSLILFQNYYCFQFIFCCHMHCTCFC